MVIVIGGNSFWKEVNILFLLGRWTVIYPVDLLQNPSAHVFVLLRLNVNKPKKHVTSTCLRTRKLYIWHIYINIGIINMFCFISTINCIYNFNIMLLQRNVYQ